MDTLSEILKTVRLETGLLSRSRLTSPWAVSTRGAPRPIFHALVQGTCFAEREGCERVRMSAGDVVVLPHGDAHIMTDGSSVTPTQVRELLGPTTEHGVPMLEHGGGGAEAIIVCGTFHLEHEAANALVEMMPPLIHLAPRDDDQARWMRSTLEQLDAELSCPTPGSVTVVGRLTDLLVVQVVRQYALSTDAPVQGFLAAAHDEQVARAIALIHSRPGEPWSATMLASRVGMSRSRFFERFTSLVGEPPARYVARWRASAAADLMRRRDLGTAELAGLVGYASETAFVRVFRRYQGLSPAEFRRRLRAPG